MSAGLTFLVIDDSPDDREAVARMLASVGDAPATTLEAETGDHGVDMLRRERVDCVFLDFSMPGSDGLAVLREIALRFPGMPIVMMTGGGNERVAVEALKGGAQDYVLKGDLSEETLRTAVTSALSSKRHEVEILRRANFDELTGLANRRMFADRLDHAIALSRGSASLAVIFIDLDGFKQVNDRHGHDAGDELLRDVALRAQGALREGDTLARLGGDEFVVLLENLGTGGADTAEAVAARLRTRIADESYSVGGGVRIGASVGIAVYPDMADNRSDLMRAADDAMYRVKEARRAGPGRADLSAAG
jgi:diguanylate cyclase (GGDEF)-like protein